MMPILRFLTLIAALGKRLCNGTVSVRLSVCLSVRCPFICLSRRSIAAKQQRLATGLLQLWRGRQFIGRYLPSPEPGLRAASVDAMTRGTRFDTGL